MTTTEETQEEKVDNVSHLAMRSRYGEFPVGEAVILYDRPLVLKAPNGTQTLTGKGSIRFEFAPDISLEFNMEASWLPASLGLTGNWMGADCRVYLQGMNRTAKVQVFDSNVSLPSGEMKLRGHLIEDLHFAMTKEDGSPESVGRIQFHLLNFRNFHGERLHRQVGDSQQAWSGRTQFEFDKWLVTLDSLPGLKKRRDRIEAQGGLAVTHIGNLCRKDGKLFSAKQAEELIMFLYWFLSFVNGARCGCILSSGLRYLPYPLWEDWTPQVTRPGKNDLSWFAENLPSECLAVAEGFYSLWRDKDKRDSLQLAVSIYTDSNSNTSGTDLELAKAQIALEMLCWTVLREENAIISEEGLEKLSAADRIRMLLSVSGIPLSIPASLGDLAKAFTTTAGADGPQATTEIRNNVVHPSKKRRDKLQGFSDMTKFDAWQLNIWYVELVMLKLFGYNGHYNNRLDRASTVGKYELVPWSKSTASL